MLSQKPEERTKKGFFTKRRIIVVFTMLLIALVLICAGEYDSALICFLTFSIVAFLKFINERQRTRRGD